MGKVILAILAIILFIYFCYLIVSGIIKNGEEKEVEYLQQSRGVLKPVKTELDYWYEKPHWYVFPDGEKINLSEYMTYEEYKSYSKPKIAQIAHYAKLSLDKEKNNNKKESL